MSDQHDDHIWLTVCGEAWAIQALEWPIVFLWRGYEPNLEYFAVEISNFDADAYADKALAMLKDAPQ